ncbi:MAG: sigma-54-dependent Fis family transcriptional regulator [Kofleriaceae bacterium]|nr:sigma-54-dependent Fis family transcriptional regulator [Kofleriaceae bacterium]
MSQVLLVDDDPGVLFTLAELLTERGHAVTTATSATQALTLLDDVDAVLTDLSMPGMTGLELVSAVRGRDPNLPVVLLTAHGSERVAVAAIKGGAFDYLTKPFDIDEVAVAIERALAHRRLVSDNRRLTAEQALGHRVVATSAAMRRLLTAVERVAGRDVTVLVRGETGTGKELVGQLLHTLSPRARGPLVRFNCAAIPPELAESELFGHAKGAFTGATAAHPGFFAAADGGTLILDEVGELPLPLQAKLLRALQEGEIQPVGSGKVVRVDVRLIAATNRDLLAEQRAGRFREDLYYRLAVVELIVPPLRDRKDDIPALAREFAARYGRRFGLGPLELADDLLAALVAPDWPGNVRELENTIARLAVLSTGAALRAVDLEPLTGAGGPPLAATGAGDAGADPNLADDPDLASPLAPGDAPSLREQVEAFERGLLLEALAAAGGNQSLAARRLGIGRVTLIDKMKKYGLGAKR